MKIDEPDALGYVAVQALTLMHFDNVKQAVATGKPADLTEKEAEKGQKACVRGATWDRHHDRYEGLKIVFASLAHGEERLGLPALGGLFAQDQLPTLGKARLTNRSFMEAIYRLSWLRQKTGMMPLNWRAMETEELGSVYESLLELQPQLGDDGRSLTFAAEAAEQRGNQRKTTGSYYTPDSLVQALLDSTLDPVLEDGIPDTAYKPLTGDDKEVATHYRNKNRSEHKERDDIAEGFGFHRQRNLMDEFSRLRAMPEDTLRQIRAKEKRLRELMREGAAGWELTCACDIYVSAFLLAKEKGAPHSGLDGLPRRGAETVPTSGTL